MADIGLFDWAYIRLDAEVSLAEELALPEKWYYGNKKPRDLKDKYRILTAYLRTTFLKLRKEKKIYETDDKNYAAFNTGLVDRKYEYIYAFFDKNKNTNAQKWHLINFVVPGEDDGKKLRRLFNPLPERADYFRGNLSSVLYDSTTGDLDCDKTHILTERTCRLPFEFLDENCNSDFTTIDGMKLNEVYRLPVDDEKRKNYFVHLGEKIKDDDKILRLLTNRLKDAVELALKKVAWNYKTAIPMYYPRFDKLSLLLPLSLVSENKVDVALVVTKNKNGSYQGETILPIDLAYSNSRLIAKPESDWLSPDFVDDSITLDIDDEEPDNPKTESPRPAMYRKPLLKPRQTGLVVIRKKTTNDKKTQTRTVVIRKKQ